jgi:hypothetical protein
MARRALVTLVVAAGSGMATEATAEPDRARCVEAYESSQQLRQQGRLIASREQLLICVQQSCPDFVRPDCERWLGEVKALLPSIVVAAKGVDGSDVTDVRVVVDDEPVAESLDGRAIPIDPGPHELQLIHGDEPPKTLSIVVQQGVKNRVLSVSWEPAKVPTPAPEPALPPPERGQPIVAYVLGGLGVAAMGAFATLGILGKREADDLNERCGSDAPPGGICTADEIDATRVKLVAADVSLGVGAALLATSVWLIIYHFASEPDEEATAIRMELGPTFGGGFGAVVVPF